MEEAQDFEEYKNGWNDAIDGKVDPHGPVSGIDSSYSDGAKAAFDYAADQETFIGDMRHQKLYL